MTKNSREYSKSMTEYLNEKTPRNKRRVNKAYKAFRKELKKHQ